MVARNDEKEKLRQEEKAKAKAEAEAVRAEKRAIKVSRLTKLQATMLYTVHDSWSVIGWLVGGLISCSFYYSS